MYFDGAELNVRLGQCTRGFHFTRQNSVSGNISKIFSVQPDIRFKASPSLEQIFVLIQGHPGQPRLAYKKNVPPLVSVVWSQQISNVWV